MVPGLYLVPVAFIVGGITSCSPVAARAVALLLYPKGISRTMYSYANTSIDGNNVGVPATAYALHCVDGRGAAIMSDPVLYAFL